MKWNKAVSYRILTEGGSSLEAEAVRLAKAWLKAFNVSRLRGVYTYDDGTKVEEDTLQIEVVVSVDNPLSALELNAPDSHMSANGQIRNPAGLVEAYVLEVAKVIADANAQECVLVVKQDASGISTLFV